MSFEQEVIEGYSISLQQTTAWQTVIALGVQSARTEISLLLRGECDPARVERALRRVIDRHEILRSSFPLAEGIGLPLQVVSNEPTFDWQFVNIAEIDAIREPTPDPTRYPALYARLVRLDEEQSRLLVSASALVLDAGSATAIARELVTAYSEWEEFADREEIPQYAQYSEYIQQWRDSEDGKLAENWWQANDGRSVPPQTFPFIRTISSTADIKSVSVPLPQEVLIRLERLAREERLSVETLLLTCWATVLMRIGDRRDGAVCIETSGRTFEEISNMPGPFSRSVPITFSPRAQDTFVDLWRSINNEVEEVRKNEDGAPSFEEHNGVQFAWADISEIFKSDHISIEVEEVSSLSSPFYLRFRCLSTSRGLRAHLDFNACAVSPVDANLLAGYLENTIAHISENLHKCPGKISLLKPETRHLLLQDWNRTERPLLDSRPFPLVFLERAKRYANRTALQQGDCKLTYRDLKRLMQNYSRELRARGIGPETVVAVTADPCIEAVVGILAILQTGGAFVPLDTTYPKQRLEWILDQSGVTTVLCRPGEEATFPKGPWTPIAIDVFAGAANSARSFQPPCDQKNAAYVIYTSGSTGEPKGVVISHESLSNYLDWCMREYAKNGSGCALHSSLAFDLSITSLLTPLLLGETVFLPNHDHRAGYLPSLLDEEREYMWIKMTPSHARIAPEQVASKTALGCARRLILGGEAVSSNDLAEWRKVMPEVEVINEYGPTEATVGCTVYRAAASALVDGPISIGRPIANAKIFILDEEMQPCPISTPGEIYISGDCLARGYLRRPDLTAERFLPNPHSEQPGARFYRTGDIARYRSDGDIEYLGRTDDQMKINGYRVEPEEIETILLRHPLIHEATVVAHVEKGDSRLVAYFTSTGGSSSDIPVGELREFLGSKLPGHMIPHAFVRLEALPLTSNGKVDRATLKKRDLSTTTTGRYSGPRTLTEEVLATIWAKVLRLDRVSIDDDYFLLGGDSIRAIQIAGIATESGLNITLASIFRHKTIRELAAALTGTAVQTLAATEPFSLISDEDRLKLPEDAEDAYGLSRLQAGMVFERQYYPGAAIYHDIFSHHIRMSLDRTKLEQAISEVVRRHPMLRTSFHIDGFSEPLQIVHLTAETPITFEDLTELSAQQQKETVAQWIEDEKRRGFDYLVPPLLRFRAHETSPESFYFSLSFHHAILDGWSDATMLVEIALSYHRLLEGKPIGLEPPDTQYRDFIAAESDAAASAEYRGYWLNLLRGCTPTTIPRWTKPTEKGNRGVRFERVVIGMERSRALINLARELAIPLKSVLLAAHLRAIGLLGGTSDVVTTISSSGRLETSDGHRVIGLHINSTPLRLDLSGGRWVDLARAAFEAEKDALPWRRYPLADVQRELGLRRLSETSFYYTHYHLLDNLSELPSFEILDQLAYEETSFVLVANFDLNPRTSEISLGLAYDQTELTSEQVHVIARYFERALASIASDPLADYNQARLISDEEVAQILNYAGEASSAGVAGSIVELFEFCALSFPSTQAVVCGDQVISYEQLNRRANQLARHLRACCAGTGGIVALLLDRSIDMIVAIFAALKTGGAYLPIEPDSPDEWINAIVTDANPLAVVTTSAHLNKIGAYVGSVIAIDRDDASISIELDSNLEDPATPDDLAYVIYTSGSTGRPKGVLVSRGNLFHSNEARFRLYRDPVSRFLLLSSYSFDSSIAGIFWTLCSGGTLVLTPGDVSKDPVALADILQSQEITHLLALPALYGALLESCADRELPEWKVAIVAGQACPIEVVLSHYSLFPSVALYNEYGPTEASVWSTVELCQPDDEIVSIGRPIPGARVYVLNKDFAPVPIGSPGELFAGGPGVSHGYLNRQELTAEKFLPDPFSSQPGARMYRTGDRVRLRPDGRIDYLGRIDLQIKLRGYRIEPEEIESAMRSLHGVRDAAVAVWEQEGGDARLIGYVVTEGEQAPEVQSIRTGLSLRLPAYMIPSQFMFLDDLPVSPNGKLDRKSLPKPAERTRSEEFVAPRNAVEQTLADIWSKVLRVSQVGIHDDFFELGGDSIISIRIVARAKQAGIQFKPAELFQARTIERLAALADQHQTTADHTFSLEVGSEAAVLPQDEMEDLLKRLANPQG